MRSSRDKDDAGPEERHGGSSAPPEVLDERQEVLDLLRDLSAELGELGRTFGARHRLHHTDVRALILVMERGQSGEPVTPGTLSRELNLTSASVTALVDRLENAGHLRRERDSADRRRVTLHADVETVRLGAAFFGPLNERMLAALAHLSGDELGVVREFLEAMTRITHEQNGA